MPLNGSGTFTRVYNWVTDRNAAVKIQASRMDTEFDGIATALSNALYRDGQATPTAPLPMGGQKLTGLGDATAATDALNRQTADGRYLAIATAVADLAANLDEAVHAITVVASASTCDIGAAPTDRVSITGTTTITSFGTGLSRIRYVSFAGALTLTHNATSLILPTSANINTVAGDTALFSSDSVGNWRCLDYQRVDGTALTIGTNQIVTASITDNNVTLAKLATQAASSILANITGGAAVPTAASLTAVLDLIGSAAQGDILYRGAASWARLGAGTAGQSLQTNGAGANPSWVAVAGGGKLVSRAYVEYSASVNLSTAIPVDDTIPQSTEGTEILNVSITPSSVTNRVRATFTGFFSGDVATSFAAAALFRDATASAIAATAARPTDTDGVTLNPIMTPITLTYEHVPGTTSATAYKIRVGPSAGGGVRMNGDNGILARRFGGVAVATLVLEEITP